MLVAGYSCKQDGENGRALLSWMVFFPSKADLREAFPFHSPMISLFARPQRE